jgi:hypothetical protein
MAASRRAERRRLRSGEHRHQGSPSTLDWFKGFGNAGQTRLKGTYWEAKYARDHLGVNNIQRVNHLDADGRDAIDFITTSGLHVECKNRTFSGVLTGENGELLDDITEQIAKHASRCPDKQIEYVFSKSFGTQDEHIRTRIIEEFRSHDFDVNLVSVVFAGYGDIPF